MQSIHALFKAVMTMASLSITLTVVFAAISSFYIMKKQDTVTVQTNGIKDEQRFIGFFKPERQAVLKERVRWGLKQASSNFPRFGPFKSDERKLNAIFFIMGVRMAVISEILVVLGIIFLTVFGAGVSGWMYRSRGLHTENKGDVQVGSIDLLSFLFCVFLAGFLGIWTISFPVWVIFAGMLVFSGLWFVILYNFRS